jgi:uncharacterized delta-60 repeat protein
MLSIGRSRRNLPLSRPRPGIRPRVEFLEERTLLNVGNLDPTFGTGGKVTTDFAGGDSSARASVVQPDGKIVVAGSVNFSGHYQFALARYNPDGTPDLSFGLGGKVTTPFAVNNDLGGYAEAYAVALQGDEILAGGITDGHSQWLFALARYTSDGHLDQSFGNNGTVTTPFDAGTGRILDLEVLSGDRILAMGTLPNTVKHDFAMALYAPDGHLVPSFGNGGTVETLFGTSDSAEAKHVAVQGDGSIVVAGNDGGLFALARYTPYGQLDPTFGTGGEVVTTAFGSSADATDVAVGPDGKIVAVGLTFDSWSFLVARYNHDGTPDTSFGGVGWVSTPVEAEGGAYSVLPQSDGTILVGGAGSQGFALARYDTTGSLDPTFGTGGMVNTAFGSGPGVAANLVQPAPGKVLAVGWTQVDGHDDFALAQYDTVTPPSITGTVFQDDNANGVQDPNEGGLSGWTVYLDLNHNGVLDGHEPSTTTDDTGSYSFSGLAPGTYTVREVLPAPYWKQTTPAAVPVTVVANVPAPADFGNETPFRKIDPHLMYNPGLVSLDTPEPAPQVTWTDVTSQLRMQIGTAVFTPATGRYRQKLTLQNLSAGALSGPLMVRLEGLGPNARLHRIRQAGSK